MLTLCINRRNTAVTQFTNYSFTSATVFGGSLLCTGSGGIYQADTGDNDDGVGISATVELPLSDFGHEGQKRVRRIHLGGEFDGDKVTVITEDGEANRREYTASSKSGLERNIYADVGRDGKSRYWKIIVKNVNGGDFSLDSVTAVVVPLNRRR